MLARVTLLSGAVAAVLTVSAIANADDAQPGSAQAVPTLNLAALTQAATRHYPAIRAAREKIAASRAQLAEATYSPFMQLTVTGGATMAPEAQGSPIFSPDSQLPIDNPWQPVVQIGVGGAVPLYTFGKLQAARQAAQAGVSGAEAERDQTLARVLYDTRRAYYALQVALDVRQMISEGQGRLERAAQRLEERIEAGDPEVEEVDRYRISSTLAEVAARRSEAEFAERTARHALSLLTGIRSFDVPACPLAPIAVELEPVERYVRAAHAVRPEAIALGAAVSAREAARDASRAGYFPDLALALNASTSYGPGITDQRNPFIQDGANYTALGAGLVTRWSLDLFGAYERERRAEAQLAETRGRVEQALDAMELEVVTSYAETQAAGAREQAWARGHRDTRAWFVATGQAYEVGAAEPKDLVDAARAYFTARYSHLDAIRERNTALANLARVSGLEIAAEDRWEVTCEDLAAEPAAAPSQSPADSSDSTDGE